MNICGCQAAEGLQKRRMLYRYTSTVVSEAERLASEGDTLTALRTLRELPLADFCQLLLEAGPAYGALSNFLPRMPTVQEQKQWTGHSGLDLMVKSCNISRLFDVVSFRETGSGLRGKTILDYGCGWGRLLRIMYYYSEIRDVYGTDPWARSLDVCRSCGLAQNLALCEPIPESVPFQLLFDFVFSYSVFTHLAERAARAVLRAVRSAIAPTGVYVITIRPEEFWHLRKGVLGASAVERAIQEHRSYGYTFTPVAFGGEVENSTYGECSISFDFMRQMADEEGWKLASVDRDLLEPYQIMIALRPR